MTGYGGDLMVEQIHHGNCEAVIRTCLEDLAALGATPDDLEELLPTSKRGRSFRSAELVAEAASAATKLGSWAAFIEACEAAQLLAVANLRRGGWELALDRSWGGWVWRHPTVGGPVYNGDEDGTTVSKFAARDFGHMLPPCSKCDAPVERHKTVDGLCESCQFWADRSTRPAIVVEQLTGERLCLSDGGHRPGVSVRDKQHLGHSGQLFRLRPILADQEEVVSNNMWSSGTIPAAWYPEFPVTHVHGAPRAQETDD